LKPETSVKNRIGGFMQHRKPLGYKPNAVTEYLMVYRKQTEKLLDWNMRSYNFDIVNESKVADGYESNNVWKIDPCFNKVHSAIFPVELCKRVIQYYSFKGDLVFDPFGGSGTVGRTAKSLERLFFLTEQEPVYFDYMQQKAKPDALFKERQTQFLSLEEFALTSTCNPTSPILPKNIDTKKQYDFMLIPFVEENAIQYKEPYQGTISDLYHRCAIILNNLKNTLPNANISIKIENDFFDKNTHFKIDKGIINANNDIIVSI
jgi:DNA methylase